MQRTFWQEMGGIVILAVSLFILLAICKGDWRPLMGAMVVALGALVIGLGENKLTD
jgi:UDP-N-acetylmuramyl pentapeptide phosphotransferase/UDP-N-acetylglucosamine-1-phosphate transferase